jgi:predicted CXXCH cytochrome family protein
LIAITLAIFVAVSAFEYAFAAKVSVAPDQSCDSSGCHEQFGKAKHVHPAMEDGDCSSCHDQQGDEHVFEYAEEDNELCFSCHDTLEKKNKHDAVEEGCTTCHNPHQSDSRYLLEADSQEELCFACHDESMIEGKWAHAPAEGGECTSCHNPHESDNRTLLAKTSPDLCFECHSDKEEELEGNSSIHAAAEDDCLNCHNPHSEERESIIIDDVPQLCFQCHDDMNELLESSAVKHGVIDQEKSCLNCHNPHVSPHDTLLKAGKEEICYTCHNRPIETETETLADIQALVDNSEYPHGPVADDDCMSCHDPHASENFRMLKARFPKKYYAPFSFRDYALCFMCHDKALILNEETEWLTSFRDGARNLHFLHVNRKDKGRKCTNCHDVHASDNAAHVRHAAMFGAWEMELMFEKTETGGSCDPGCHSYRAYDKKKPVNTDWQPTRWEEEVHFK